MPGRRPASEESSHVGTWMSDFLLQNYENTHLYPVCGLLLGQPRVPVQAIPDWSYTASWGLACHEVCTFHEHPALIKFALSFRPLLSQS